MTKWFCSGTFSLNSAVLYVTVADESDSSAKAEPRTRISAKTAVLKQVDEEEDMTTTWQVDGIYHRTKVKLRERTTCG